MVLVITNSSTFHCIILRNADPTHPTDIYNGNSATINVGLGDLLQAFNFDNYDPNNLNNGSLLFEETVPPGCAYAWLLSQFFDSLTVTEATCDPPCANAVTCACDPVFTEPPPNPPPPPIVFFNTQQCAVARCQTGTGQPVTVCKAAGLYSSTLSQADANNIAYQAALMAALNQLDCGLAGQLNGLRWEMPCTNGLHPCSCTDPSDNSQIAQGNPGQIYTVQLRVRGLVELKPYAFYGVGGAGNGNVFVCSNPNQTIPAAGGHNDNEYAIVISNPAATIMLNNSNGNSPPTQSVKVDYQLTIYIQTGGVITAKARSIDGSEWDNAAHTIVNTAPPPVGVTEPYLGQYLEIFVLSIQ